MRIGRIGLLMGSLACLGTGGLAAQSAMEISRAVYVEQRGEAPTGGMLRTIGPASTLTKGDRVVLLVEWNAASPGFKQDQRGFTISSPVPSHLAFQRSSQDGVEISPDGGRNWGVLGRMRIDEGGSSRLVSPEDATHVRWNIAPSHLVQGRGRIAYSAIVR